MRAILIILITLSAGAAKTFYIDPVAGNINNAGDLHHPWDTLEEVFRQRKVLSGGDSLLLFNGHHGSPVIRGNNSLFITISAYKDHRPNCRSVTFDAAKKWQLAEVIISPETSPEYAKTTLVKINRNASEIIVENCIAYSVLDSSPWSQKDWVDKSCSGASIEGSNNTIRYCHFLNIKHGILVESTAEHNLIDHNVIENFAADGMRGIGSYNTFQYNTVKNCYDVDDNHDDGFQSYSYRDGQVDHNYTLSISSYDDYFVNVGNFDLSLKEGARAIDRGSEQDAPSIDIVGTSRPQGAGFDLGAYEFIDLTGVLHEDAEKSSPFSLQNYPNPFNPATMITYSVPRTAFIELSIFNLLGEHIATLVHESQTAGEHAVLFDANQLPSGIYLCKISMDGFEDILKIVLRP